MKYQPNKNRLNKNDKVSEAQTVFSFMFAEHWVRCQCSINNSAISTWCGGTRPHCQERLLIQEHTGGVADLDLTLSYTQEFVQEANAVELLSNKYLKPSKFRVRVTWLNVWDDRTCRSCMATNTSEAWGVWLLSSMGVGSALRAVSKNSLLHRSDCSMELPCA